MLTPEQISALRDAFGRMADPINDFLIDDIARRIAGAGQLTSTAAYQVWRAQQLGMSRRAIEKRLREELGVGRGTLKALLTQAAEVGYDFDLRGLSRRAVPFRKNTSLQQMVAAAVELAQADFTNLTQTLGMVGPDGVAYPLQEAYRKSMDYAFQQVFTGAADYNTAIRQATKHLADLGVRVIDYESGVHTSLEAATRRNMMGGLGLMVEQIAQKNHDDLGADGWEISAHAASAPDHEPIQGRQYGDAAYKALNGSLKRRIGTLNCGHMAFPILLGVNSPQYTPEELQKFRADNEAGVTYQGKHYTGYEATQMQRRVETAMRTQKRRVLVAEATGDKEKLTTGQIRLQRLREEYGRFSKAAGLPTQPERAQVAGFGRGQAARATAVRTAAAADAARNTGRPVKFSDSADYTVELDRYSAKVNQGLSNAARTVAQKGSVDGLERLELVDLKTGKTVVWETGESGEVGYDFWDYIRAHPEGRFGFVHNHNTDGWLSEQDLTTLLTTKEIDVMIAVRNDGVIYVAPKDAGAQLSTLPRIFYAADIERISQMNRAGELNVSFKFASEQKMVENMLRDFVRGYFETNG